LAIILDHDTLNLCKIPCDVLSLQIAWGAYLMAARTGTEKRTYGFRKITIIGSLASALLLLVALGGIT
jgi:cobalt-zinc-cadmium efflux system protein